MPIRVLIADDHELVRSGLQSLLAGPEIKVVGQAASRSEAVRLARQHKPDVVLLDIRMADGGDGLDALQQIGAALPDTRVIMLSTFDNPTYVARSAALGASDYLLKGATGEKLVAAIKAAHAGKKPLKDELRRLASRTTSDKAGVEMESVLTPREDQVLRHVALGLSNKEIGRALEISVDTVKEHVQNVLRKLEAVDRTQAAVWAVKRGLV